MPAAERAGGGWYPPDHGQTAADLYAKWLHARDLEDTPERREAYFAGFADGPGGGAAKSWLKVIYGGDACPQCGAILDYGEDEPGEPYLIHPAPQCGWMPRSYPERA